MTKDEWMQAEKRLSWTGARIKLDCDGYDLSICRERYHAMRDCLTVYVNGVWKGEWLVQDCEERRRFAAPLKRYYHRPKMHAAMKANRAKQPRYILATVDKALGKLADPDATFTIYSPVWGSFKRLRQHLVKNNKQISMAKEEAAAISVKSVTNPMLAFGPGPEGRTCGECRSFGPYREACRKRTGADVRKNVNQHRRNWPACKYFTLVFRGE